ncbi:MAG: lysophospholipid acyltransferase family protein [Anaerohalosphaeraceae bacterium]|nr:lysophospholipid acyltransferase family protein [Anaerohalosphaeraceae bacterium]
MANTERKRRRKKRKKTLVEHWLLYILLRAVLCVVFLFKVETMLKFACFLGRALWKHYPRGRQRAIDNLKASYPEKDDKWIAKTGRRSFEQLVMLVIDILFTPRIINRDNWEQYSTYKNIERVKWMMQEGRPLIMVAGHYSNFEIMGYLLGVFGFNIFSIARPLDNKFINRYLYSIREKKGQKIIDKKGAADQMEKIVAGGGTLCFVADQDAGKKGVFVDFFGRKASSYKSIALLAMQYNIPICVGISRRVENRFFFEIEVERVIMPSEWADKTNPLEWITAEYTKAFEMGIRKDPSQYWWIHRRWKTRPKSERKLDTDSHR